MATPDPDPKRSFAHSVELKGITSTEARVEDEWERLAQDLAAVFADMEEDDFFVLSDKRSGLYVQFAAQGKFGFRAEAVSPTYAGKTQVPEQVCSALLELGWNAPTKLPDDQDPEGHTPDGALNFFLGVDHPVPYDALAVLAVVTMWHVFGTSHPGELHYQSFGLNNVELRFPHLRIKRGR